MKQHISRHPSFCTSYYFHLSSRHYRRNHRHRGVSPETKEIGDRNTTLMNCTATVKSPVYSHACVHTRGCTRASLHKKKPRFRSAFHITVCSKRRRRYLRPLPFIFCYFCCNGYFLSSLHLTIRHNYTCVKYS